MTEYITKDEAYNAVDERIGALLIYHSNISKILCVDSIKKHIDTIKPADVAPVIHGKWIKGQTQEKVDWLGVRCKVANYSCSICGRVIPDIDVDGKGLVATLDDYPYCHCGAKMDKED